MKDWRGMIMQPGGMSRGLVVFQRKIAVQLRPWQRDGENAKIVSDMKEARGSIDRTC